MGKRPLQDVVDVARGEGALVIYLLVPRFCRGSLRWTGVLYAMPAGEDRYRRGLRKYQGTLDGDVQVAGPTCHIKRHMLSASGSKRRQRSYHEVVPSD